MSNNISPKKGYGSFFSYVDPKLSYLATSENSFHPENNKLFYTGRHAIKYVIETIKLDLEINTFWLPEYYCQHVAHWLKSNYNNIKTYKVDPADPDFIIDGNRFIQPNDVVLVNNFWGISKCNFSCNTKSIIIEDHSHGWLSTSCINSKADFCVASLRKSVPAPLGGMAWKPNGEALKKLDLEASDIFTNIWNTTALAMRKKHTFEKEDNGSDDLKNEFLALINDAENKMHHNYDLVELSKANKDTLTDYLKVNYLQLKTDNYQKLMLLLKDNKNFKVLNNMETPFGLTVHFDEITFMNNFKNHLVSNNIYPSLLWPNNPVEYGFFLNIHIDYRYNENNMTYISQIINQF